MSTDVTPPRGGGDTDDALRSYLDDLRHDELHRIDETILGNVGSMERIALMAERRRLLARRREREAAFVAHAAAWSTEQRIGRAAFLAEGVPDAVLDRAGIRD